MPDIHAVLSSAKTHKEQVAAITRLALRDRRSLGELIDLLEHGTDVEKGTAAEAMKFVSQEDPARLVPHMDVLIRNIDYRAPRVRWGCPEAIGNIAKKYPEKVVKAVPKLLDNLKDDSTVVRWCAAYALAEIAKNNLKEQKGLVSKFKSIIRAEKNNGVRNVLIKAVAAIGKAK
jgi:HEAT repeat protein